MTLPRFTFSPSHASFTGDNRLNLKTSTCSGCSPNPNLYLKCFLNSFRKSSLRENGTHEPGLPHLLSILSPLLGSWPSSPLTFPDLSHCAISSTWGLQFTPPAVLPFWLQHTSAAAACPASTACPASSPAAATAGCHPVRFPAWLPHGRTGKAILANICFYNKHICCSSFKFR